MHEAQQVFILVIFQCIRRTAWYHQMYHNNFDIDYLHGTKFRYIQHSTVHSSIMRHVHDEQRVKNYKLHSTVHVM